ncbi:hypothetical protein HK101_010974 [Irineochytrium annulatum]|nr:hypothetical protein HK101_010974 [Irineochytrium annulatum]
MMTDEVNYSDEDAAPIIDLAPVLAEIQILEDEEMEYHLIDYPTEEDDERALSRDARRNHLLSLVVVTIAMLSIEKTPEHTSILTGDRWLKEQLDGHRNGMHQNFRIGKQLFLKLSDELAATGRLRRSRYKTHYEQVAHFRPRFYDMVVQLTKEEQDSLTILDHELAAASNEQGNDDASNNPEKSRMLALRDNIAKGMWEEYEKLKTHRRSIV